LYSSNDQKRQMIETEIVLLQQEGVITCYGGECWVYSVLFSSVCGCLSTFGASNATQYERNRGITPLVSPPGWLTNGGKLRVSSNSWKPLKLELVL